MSQCCLKDDSPGGYTIVFSSVCLVLDVMKTILHLSLGSYVIKNRRFVIIYWFIDEGRGFVLSR
jgi:hypothetical protein